MPGYQTPKRQVEAEYHTIYSAVLQHIKNSGFELLDANPQTGRIEAQAPIELMLDLHTRQHWTFHTSNQQVAAELTFEVNFNPSSETEVWISEEGICDDYSYLRERLQLDAIVEVINQGRKDELQSR